VRASDFVNRNKKEETMKKLCISGLISIVCCLSGVSVMAEIVKVGGYIFPPFVEKTGGSRETGLAIDMLDAMNDYQDTYQFQFVPTSPKRRYRDFEQGVYDMMLFESPEWGWAGMDIEVSNAFLQGGEVYITKADPSKEQQYFESFEGKSMALYRGYHYGFADFNADEQFLQEHFNAQFSNSHEGNIIKIIKDRADIAVVTQAFLAHYLKDNPDIGERLLISSKLDQEYQHTILIRKNTKPTVDEINALLTGMEQAGILERLWKQYGLASPSKND
jgi:ABC-type amino acid transport substrate-binding protein